MAPCGEREEEKGKGSEMIDWTGHFLLRLFSWCKKSVHGCVSFLLFSFFWQNTQKQQQRQHLIRWATFVFGVVVVDCKSYLPRLTFFPALSLSLSSFLAQWLIIPGFFVLFDKFITAAQGIFNLLSAYGILVVVVVRRRKQIPLFYRKLFCTTPSHKANNLFLGSFSPSPSWQTYRRRNDILFTQFFSLFSADILCFSDFVLCCCCCLLFFLGNNNSEKKTNTVEESISWHFGEIAQQTMSIFRLILLLLLTEYKRLPNKKHCDSRGFSGNFPRI